MNRIIRVVWVLSLVLLIAQSVYYYPQLPERIASHFDSSGQVNGWSSKSGFYILWYFLILFMNIWVPLTGVLIRKLPVSMISVPNREYWLGSDNRKQELISIMSATMGIVFTGVNLIMLLAMQHTALFNLGQRSSISVTEILILAAADVIFAIAYPVYKLRRKER